MPDPKTRFTHLTQLPPTCERKIVLTLQDFDTLFFSALHKGRTLGMELEAVYIGDADFKDIRYQLLKTSPEIFINYAGTRYAKSGADMMYHNTPVYRTVSPRHFGVSYKDSR